MGPMDRERILQTFLALVTTDSGSLKEGQMADQVERRLKAMGFDVWRDDAGEKAGGETGNVIGRLPGTRQGRTLLLTAHMDRVSPGTGIKPQSKDGVITSDGTTILGADDAAGITGILEGIRTALDRGTDRPNIEVIFSIGEEIGLVGSRNVDLSQLTATECYVLDSSTPVGSMICQAPAQAELNFTIIGKAAHAGVEPEKGISALQVAAKAIGNMKLGRIDGETTANFGIVRGGVATNIVMERLELLGDVRSMQVPKLEAQVEHMTRCVARACEEAGARFERQYAISYGPLNLQPEDFVVRQAEAAIRRAGLQPQRRATGGGSDANIYNTRGLPAINLGCGYRGAHSLQESQAIEALEDLCRVVLGLIEEYAAL